MEYRVLPHGGEQVSVIGMGSSVIGAQPEKEIIATVRAAVDSGVNYFDMAAATPPSLPPTARRWRASGTRCICKSTSARTTPPASMAGRRSWPR